ncbi:hypothetical protein L249_7829 [Ophiocordyceps polyrhachis-furcata BCC 54312]|uniref:Extracellular membrane protein CFEM domain-containing protein n=1 Tax=Ophiocordyceps polyrhachis-furcata BCC 54312 TaxID=1330021 RepID=A0A367L0P4_9HYPO|nr:hypothetical protein L249_7829 [Ophiocordyceps polyrhachis-furcata BCC 54312]
MKFSSAAVLALAAAVSASTEMGSQLELDIGSLLQQIGPLIKKGQCAAPCIYQVVNNLNCQNGGIVDTLCNDLDEISAKVSPCVSKCGIDAGLKNTFFRISSGLCAKRGQ